ncbi:hypothetical protein [Kibdelosporangium phytohabitans]|nr:hypothetical protein [Kibdelosporangium phytohabitans]MBE1461576.1 hypothetical protein [Kibdelosporangium phytohabitans]
MSEGVEASTSRGWPRWVAGATAVWSLGYGGLAVSWALGGRTYPYGANDPGAEHASLLSSVPTGIAAPVLACVILLGGVLALWRPRGWPFVAFGWTVTVGLLLLIDLRLFNVLGYLVTAPFLVVAALFAEKADLGLFTAWPVWNQVVVLVGAILWAGTTLVSQRATRGGCGSCGRRPGLASAAWTTPPVARRWGTWAVVVAVLAPLPYAVVRYVWALGVPWGISPEFHAAGWPWLWVLGAGLATAAVGGAVLTLGLIRPWGEVFPRWVPRLRGRPVPPGLPLWSGGLVAVILTMANVSLAHRSITTGEPMDVLFQLWVLWGLGLGGATLAYYYRTRGRCRRCDRGA